jgi:hypothetical protein
VGFTVCMNWMHDGAHVCSPLSPLGKHDVNVKAYIAEIL